MYKVSGSQRLLGSLERAVGLALVHRGLLELSAVARCKEGTGILKSDASEAFLLAFGVLGGSAVFLPFGTYLMGGALSWRHDGGMKFIVCRLALHGPESRRVDTNAQRRTRLRADAGDGAHHNRRVVNVAEYRGVEGGGGGNWWRLYNMVVEDESVHLTFYAHAHARCGKDAGRRSEIGSTTSSQNFTSRTRTGD